MSIALCMIVKNEAYVIERCLRSVLPVIDSWAIVDTASTDDIKAIVERTLSGLPGVWADPPWIDFATNRNEALRLAEAQADYVLIIDADDELIIPEGWTLPALDHDAFWFDVRHDGLTYRRPHLIKANAGWHWRGVAHEFLNRNVPSSHGNLPLAIRYGGDGARAQDPTKHAKVAMALDAAIQSGADPDLVPRYTFYLAQSWRDCGEHEKAIAAYLARAEMGGWAEERYVSLLEAGRLMRALGSVDDALSAFEKATSAVPGRVEAAYAATKLLMQMGRHHDAFSVAKTALDRAPPPGGLFVENWVYEYGLRDEFAVAAYWTGHFSESLEACLTLLAGDALPASERPRVAQNARFAADRLSG